MSNDFVTQPEQEIDFVEYLRLWASPDGNDRAVRDLHKAADEIERLREQNEYLKANVEMLLSEARQAEHGIEDMYE